MHVKKGGILFFIVIFLKRDTLGGISKDKGIVCIVFLSQSACYKSIFLGC